MSSITALTVQSTVGVRVSYPVPAHILEETLECLEEDLVLSAIKIGMLATTENVSAVSTFLRRHRTQSHVPVVLDPAIKASSGAELLSEQGIKRRKKTFSRMSIG